MLSLDINVIGLERDLVRYIKQFNNHRECKGRDGHIHWSFLKTASAEIVCHRTNIEPWRWFYAKILPKAHSCFKGLNLVWMGLDCRFLFQGLKSVLKCVLKKIHSYFWDFIHAYSFTWSNSSPPPNNPQICVNLNQEWQKISVACTVKLLRLGQWRLESLPRQHRGCPRLWLWEHEVLECLFTRPAGSEVKCPNI